jgi:AraC-like DNA-binding protein
MAVGGFFLFICSQGMLLAFFILALRPAHGQGYGHLFLGAFVFFEALQFGVFRFFPYPFIHFSSVFIGSLIFFSGPAIYLYTKQLGQAGEFHCQRSDLVHLLPWLGAVLLLQWVPALDLEYYREKSSGGAEEYAALPWIVVGLAKAVTTLIYCLAARRNIESVLIEKMTIYPGSVRTINVFLSSLLSTQAVDGLLCVAWFLVPFPVAYRFLFSAMAMSGVFYLVTLKMLDVRLFSLERTASPENSVPEDAAPVMIIGSPAASMTLAEPLSFKEDTSTPVMAAGAAKEKCVREKYAKSGLQKERSEDLWNKLLECLENKKLYLDMELDLGKLAHELMIRPQLLSQVINYNSGKTFYEFICEYRINAAKQALSEPHNAGRKLVDIAWSSGFSSHSAFFYHFKRSTGMTPSSFRELTSRALQNTGLDEDRCLQAK